MRQLLNIDHKHYAKKSLGQNFIHNKSFLKKLSDLILTDDNTEIWQDINTNNTADVDEFSNIEFTSAIDGDNVKFNYTQDAGFTTEISYTVKRWTM